MSDHSAHDVARSPVSGNGSAGPAVGPAGRRSWSIIGELCCAAAVAVATSLPLQYLITHAGLPRPRIMIGPDKSQTLSKSLIPLEFASLGALALLGAIAFLILRGGKRPLLRTVLTWVLLTALPTIVLALPLYATKWYYGGLAGDNSFRSQYLTRMTDSPRLSDMNYESTPPLYPTGWFWLGGRFANLFGLAGWEAYKPFTILTAGVTVALAFTLWSAIVSRPMAIALSTATTLVGLSGMSPAVNEGYAWVVTALAPPVVVAIAHVLARGGREAHRDRRPKNLGVLLGIGVFLGISALFYTLITGFLTLVIIASAVVGLVLDRRRSARIPNPRGAPPSGYTLGTVLGRLLAIAGAAAVLILPVWLPYLLESLRQGMPRNAAQHYLFPEGATFATPMLDFTPIGVLCLIGVVWLIWAAGAGDVIARGLAIGVVGCYTWSVFSFAAGVADTTLLTFRVTPILELCLAAAGVFGLAAGLREIRARATEPRIARTALAVVTVLAVASGVVVAQQFARSDRGSLDQALGEPYPDGHEPRIRDEPPTGDTLAALELDRMVFRAIADATKNKAPNKTVLLTDNYRLLAIKPYWGFLAYIPQYSNPLGELDARQKEVARWAAADSAQDLIKRMKASPWRAPDVMLLRAEADGYHARMVVDAFPMSPENQWRDVVFPKKLIDPAVFDLKKVGPFTLVSPR
ncbi:galactan 5-O-arabinofuranosyltransferase [Embleya sp. NBC_00888]|uniref:arabinofuranosyltransferase n=1 Tax=Embleya sp. NBC_00888 TaxID=2975960 RepID=UPI0038665BDD|nr:galactan 5-O-arabinofuranosyltransferase [Embleya sp. NBC_00888]